MASTPHPVGNAVCSADKATEGRRLHAFASDQTGWRGSIGQGVHQPAPAPCLPPALW